MFDSRLTASRIFRGVNEFREAYHAALQPLCRETALPPPAVDILMFFANNPGYPTARDVCDCRGLKPGIVSVHIDRLVQAGLLERQSVPGDRRKTRLLCTKQAEPIIQKGRALQEAFAARLMQGLSEAEVTQLCTTLHTMGQNLREVRAHGL